MRLGRGLSRRGHALRLAFPIEAADWIADFNGAAGPSSDLTLEATPSLLRIHARRGISDMLALRRYVRQNRADVVNIHYGVAHIPLRDVLALRGTGARLVVTLHHLDTSTGRARPSTVVSAWVSDRVIVTTDKARRRLLRSGVPQRKVSVVPLGVDPPDPPVDRQAARRQLGLAPETFVIGSVARLVPEKGMADLIEAVATMRGESHLIIAGDGPSRAGLEALARDRLGPRCQVLGRVNDPGVVYAAADVFALSSHEEGFGLVFVEAGYYGLPSVAYAVGGVPEVVRDGETGLLVARGDVHGLSLGLERLRENADLRAAYGSASRTRAHRLFTIEAMTDACASVFGLE